MTRKEKIIIASVIMGIGTLFNLFFTATLHRLLSDTANQLTLIPLWECLVGICTIKQQSLLFLSFEGFLVLCCLLFFVQNNRPYQSDLLKITEDIYTPAQVGQNQHGSSRWLREKEKEEVFTTVIIDVQNEVISELLETGYANLDFLGESKKKEETRQSETPISGVEALPISIKQQSGKEMIDEDFETVDFNIKSANLSLSEVKEETKKPQKEPTKKDKYKLFPKGGIVVGMAKEGENEKLHLVGSDTHTLTIGATRSGKTRCLVIQSICTLGLAGESMVVSDPKAGAERSAMKSSGTVLLNY